ncbi:MAG: SDR family oxidoreductase [Alphaproteobacteria bacterium]|jgi:NAD(P)-dependent dehydrogenase (short-subunit alcohol dehydrogenase family)
MGILDDKHCIITGGAGSVGLASAKAMAEEGARIMLVDRDMAALEQAADSIGAKDTLIAAADISDSTQVQAFVKQAAENWGKIDVVFANAGISGTNASVADFPEDVFDDVMDINVRGTFLTLKHAIPHMRDGGSIVVTSSIMGVRTRPGTVAYITSKHALIGMVRCVARELAGRNIRANIIAPGPLENEFQQTIEDRVSAAMGVNATEMLNNMIPLGRHGTAEEISRAVLFLASDQSSFTTGAVLMADGGWHS